MLEYSPTFRHRDTLVAILVDLAKPIRTVVEATKTVTEAQIRTSNCGAMKTFRLFRGATVRKRRSPCFLFWFCENLTFLLHREQATNIGGLVCELIKGEAGNSVALAFWLSRCLLLRCEPHLSGSSLADSGEGARGKAAGRCHA